MSARLACSLVLAVALGAEDVAWPTLPDPIGLGPRLVTLAWLHERGVRIPAGTSDANIIASYRRAQTPDVAQELTAIEAGEISRIRYLLRRDHKLNPADTTTLAELRGILAQALTTAELLRMQQSEAAAATIAAGGPARVISEEPRADIPTVNTVAKSTTDSDVVARHMTHVEVVYTQHNYTTYRFNDGSATIVRNLIEGDGQRTDIDPPPKNAENWGMCVLEFRTAVYHRPGRLLFWNGTDREVWLALSTGHATLAPPNSFRETLGPVNLDPINTRPTLTARAPQWTVYAEVRVTTYGGSP